MSDRVTLSTSRLELRPWRPSDVKDVVEYANDAEFSRYLSVPYPYRIEHAEQFVAANIAAPWDVNPRFCVVVEDRAVGGVDLRIRSEDAVGEIGYALARRLWGRGLMAEAAGTVIAWAFRSRGLEKVWATADLRNTASWRVMEKLGMQREGLLRSHRVLRGVRQDVVQHGLLRGEWRPGQD